MARIDDDGSEAELFIDGNFVASWRSIEIREKDMPIILGMLDEAVKYGKIEKAKEIRNSLDMS